MKTTFTALVAAALLAAAPAPAGSATAGAETYDLLFKGGTLDAVPRDYRLVYTRAVTNTYKPETEERDSGRIELTFDDGTPQGAFLRFYQDDKHRNIGTFPASVGNPIIMYFVETVVRDMAESAGGSPFYIRNRVKEALVAPAEIADEPAKVGGQEVAAREITIRPFAGDPNAERMQGFGDLEIRVTMSDEVPGWYYALEAVVPGKDGPRYASTMTFTGEDKVE